MFNKDARPRDTIRLIRQILMRAGFDIEELSWKHPVPHVWSVHVRDRRCRRLFANGKGVSRELVLASALGEFMERLNTGYLFGDYAVYGVDAGRGFVFFPDEKWFSVNGQRVPQGILDAELLDFYDPAKELTARHLVYRTSAGLRAGICAIPFTRARDGKKIFFPLGILDNLYASNGMAAGNSPQEARVQALSEILERYVKFKVIREGLALPDVPARYYECYPGVTAALKALQQRGFNVLVKDASLGGRYPVANITLVKRDSAQCFLSFGAHPSFEVAISRTLTELLQGQDLRRFHGFQKPCASLSEAADPANLEMHFIDSSGVVAWDFFRKKADFPFCLVDHAGARKDEFDYLMSVIRKQGKDIYIADFPESGFYACRIVVPGMSEIYPVEDLISANNNRGIKLREYITRLPGLDKNMLRRFLRELDAGYAGDTEFVYHVIGIALDEGSPWQEICFGELKLLVQLALGKTGAARKQLMWCFDAGCLREAVRPVYECLEFILDKKDVSIDMTRFFDASVIKAACGLAQGKGVFNGLCDGKGNLCGARAHQELLRAFFKARKMRKKPGMKYSKGST